MNEGRGRDAVRTPPGDRLVVAHGGTEAQQYRNVLQALDGALSCGADMFEFDVRVAADGTLVVHHDAAIAARALSTMTYAEAAALTASLGYTLPRFDDVLDRAAGRIRLDIELKEAGLEDVLFRKLEDRGYPLENLVVTSFEQAALGRTHAVNPSVRTGLLVYDVSAEEAFALFRRSGAHFLGPDYRILDEGALKRAETDGIPLLPWTVNDASAMAWLLGSASVIGVITDHPADAVRARG